MLILNRKWSSKQILHTGGALPLSQLYSEPSLTFNNAHLIFCEQVDPSQFYILGMEFFSSRRINTMVKHV